LLEKRDAMLALPYVAIVDEKVRELQVLASKLMRLKCGFYVAEYAGCRGHFPPRKPRCNVRTLYVATSEKGNSLWRYLCKDGHRREEIGTVVFDEFHMLGEGGRGTIIEELVVSLLHAPGKFRTPARQSADKAATTATMTGDHSEGDVDMEVKEDTTMGVRIVALSATIGNPASVRDFLGGGIPGKCVLYNTTQRPVAIREYLVVAGNAVPILRGDGNVSGKGKLNFSSVERRMSLPPSDRLADPAFQKIFASVGWDSRVITKLAFDSMRDSAPVLIFCNTRRKCVDLCSILTAAYKKLCKDHLSAAAKQEERHVSEGAAGVNRQEGYCAVESGNKGESSTTSDCGMPVVDASLLMERENIIGHLLQESKGTVDKALLQGIRVGIGFHSAALHAVERKAVEEAYAKGILSILCCTSTLAAGVNLPAARVIITTPWTVGRFITCSSYMQKVGRAGRGVDLKQQQKPPHSFIFMSSKDVPLFEELLERHVEDVVSQLDLHSPYYKKSGTMTKASSAIPQNAAGVPMEQKESVITPDDGTGEYSGITRLLLSVLDLERKVVHLDEVFRIYSLTFKFQAGENINSGYHDSSVVPSATVHGTPRKIRSFRPLLRELQVSYILWLGIDSV
jgi:replicative superfamily II helicase